MDYGFETEAATTKEQVFMLLQNELPHFGFRYGDWGGRGGNRLLINDHLAVAFGGREHETQLGFVSRSNVLMQVVTTPEAIHQSITEMMSVVMVLLQNLHGDAVLEEEQAEVLRRQAGKMTLNATAFRHSEYLQQAQGLIAVPYEEQELPYWQFQPEQ